MFELFILTALIKISPRTIIFNDFPWTLFIAPIRKCQTVLPNHFLISKYNMRKIEESTRTHRTTVHREEIRSEVDLKFNLAHATF